MAGVENHSANDSGERPRVRFDVSLCVMSEYPMNAEDLSYNMHMAYLVLCKEAFDCGFRKFTFSGPPGFTPACPSCGTDISGARAASDQGERAPLPHRASLAATVDMRAPPRKPSGTQDSGTQDSGTQDSGTQDSGTQDSGTQDSGTQASGTQDSGTQESGSAADAEGPRTPRPRRPRLVPRGPEGASQAPAAAPVEAPRSKRFVEIDVELGGLDDLLRLIREHPESDEVEYSVDMTCLHRARAPLIELSRMVGMHELKDSVVDQVIYYAQGFNRLGSGAGDFMHTVIYGPPGTGKTEVAKIIGRIFSQLGVLSGGGFRKVTRADLVGEFLGHTAVKTRDVVRRALGGVLFIDEAYSLGAGNDEKRDSFAKECIDTLCEALSDHKDSIMVIIAGYEEELERCFFAQNRGLESRFSWRFQTHEYSAGELRAIFLKKVADCGWTIAPGTGVSESWFAENHKHFKHGGRDMESLLAKTKICHSRRVFCKRGARKTEISMDDVSRGLELHRRMGNSDAHDAPQSESHAHMYV